MLRLVAVLLCSAPLLAQGFTPEEAVKRMKLPAGFSVRAVATEPMIRQPLSISFDNRGRLWVLQYLQYPNPAGLKAVKQDKYLRTVWDKVPDAPPKGPKGLDRITICSDPDANGVFTKSKDFVTGLNLASGFCLAPGGVYVVQPPYLLYYPDKNEDDVPDGDPEVLLTGFGMNDTHSMANSLQFGPDGWLYGAAGSTSTSNIKNPNDPKQPVIEFQQGVWRFHPKTKKFELFSEGGGNTYGLDFDRNGQCITGTNWGGFAMLHQMQGAYYVKGFSKHGPLHNPYAYGYFDHVPYKNFKGGHVTCGGILYEADAYPKEYRHQYIAGNLLSNAVYWHKMTPKGASFTAEHGGELLEANDTWFRPVDLQLGPDGCVYVADWYDKRAAHLDPMDNWDKTNGRVYKIEYTKGERRDVSPPVFDLRKKTNVELVDLLKNPNIWYRRQARELLGARKVEPALVAKLRKQLADEKGTNALEALWALNAVGGLDAGTAIGSMKHADEQVRAWAVRLSVDSGVVPAIQLASATHALAVQETSAVVLAQLFASAKFMNRQGYWGIATSFLFRPGENRHPDDPSLPLLLWWATQAHDRLLLDMPDAFNNYLLKSETSELARFVFERLTRKAVVEGVHDIAMLLRPDFPKTFDTTLRAFDAALPTPTADAFRKPVLAWMGSKKVKSNDHILFTRLLVRLGDEKETKLVVARLKDDKLAEKERIGAMQLLSLVKSPELRAFVPTVLETAKSQQLLLAGIAAVEGFDDAKSAELMLAKYATWPVAVKKRAVLSLLSRPTWALKLFQAWDAGKFPKADLTLDHGRTAVQLGDKALTAFVEKHFGKIAPATAGEKQARIAALNLNMSRAKPGDPANGKVIFTKTCAACHQLHGEGTKIGPDLTTADRKNRMYMLMNIVDPSGYIRPEYITHTVNTLDGRTATGVVVEQSPESLTLANYVNSKVEKAVIAKRDIDKLEPSSVSVMPEKLLDTMTDDQIRDLFAYLASDVKANPDRKVGGAKKYKVALVSGSLEYKSDESMTAFAKMLEEKYPVECVKMFRKSDANIPGIGKLGECDIAVFFTRRLTIDGEQLKAVTDYCESGKPVIGIRTASHGFQKWLDMDKDVFGGSYKGHFGAGLKCDITIQEKAKDHPVLKGFKPFSSTASLYKNPANAKDVTVLLMGAIPKQSEPLAWVRERDVNKVKQRVFYTSLGHLTDFKEAAFNRLLVNALGWCLKDETTFAK